MCVSVCVCFGEGEGFRRDCLVLTSCLTHQLTYTHTHTHIHTERLMLHVIGFNLYIETPKAKVVELGLKLKSK